MKRKEKKRKEKKRKEKKRKEKKRKDYAFRRQFNEKSSIIPGCPEPYVLCYYMMQADPTCLLVCLSQSMILHGMGAAASEAVQASM